MGGKATLLSLVLCVLLFTLADRSFSRARGPQTPAEQQRWLEDQKLKHQQMMEELQRNAERERVQNEERQKATRKLTDEYSDEAYREAIGATAEQWKIIKPRFERTRRFASTPSIRISVYAFGGSGGSSSSSHVQGSAGVNGTSGSGSYSDGTGGSGGSAAGYGFAGGTVSGPVKKKVGDTNLGWRWERPSLRKGPAKLSQGEKTCEQLLGLLETEAANPDQVRRQVEALRQAREQQRQELREAQKQLREVVTPEQEAKLVLMGYLE